jgi:hypothetical protein
MQIDGAAAATAAAGSAVKMAIPAAVAFVAAVPIAVGLGLAALFMSDGNWMGVVLLALAGIGAHLVARLLHSSDPLHWNRRSR